MRSNLRCLSTLLDKTSRYHPSPITIDQLIKFGKKRDESLSYDFLHQELPIRISHMVKELHMLPESLLDQRSVKLVKDMYLKTFEELSVFDGDGTYDEQTLSKFKRRLQDIKRRHQTVVETMAEGILALKNEQGDRFDPSINYFLDRFYTSRIAIRVLISNHLILFGPDEESPGHCGIVDQSMDVHDIVDEAVSNARYLCNHHYGDCPSIEINTYIAGHQNKEPSSSTGSKKRSGQQEDIKLLFSNAVAMSNAPALRITNPRADSVVDNLIACQDGDKEAESTSLDKTGTKESLNPEVTMVYIASHLHHMVFELVKNALRASVEHPLDGKPQPVRILIVQGERDISIKVSDKGGGIPMRLHDHLFDYHYSTAPPPEPEQDSRYPPLAGFGYGLPLSRLYARYLNGNIRLMSVEGYGTDAVIYLQNFSEDACEVLPLFNKTSQAKYQIGTMVQDWNVGGSTSRPIWS